MKDLRNEGLLNAQIVNIQWDRMHLLLDIEIDFFQKEILDLEFYMVNSSYKAKGKFQVLECNRRRYKLGINITNNGENRCYPAGTYNIYICKGEKFFGLCKVSNEVADILEENSRNFLYTNRKKVYTVSFFVGDSIEDVIFEIYILASAKCEMSFPKYGRFRKIFINTLREIKHYLTNEKITYRKFYNKYRKKKKVNTSKPTLLFMSEQSDTLGANLMAVKNRLIQRGMEKEYCILTSTRLASSIEQSKKSWYELLKKIAQSDMIFLDDHAPVFDWLEVDKDTKIVQLWHAGVGFKAAGYSRWGHKGGPSPVSCHRQYTYGIASSKNAKSIFAEVWGINTEQIIPTGLPRMDKYLDIDYKQRIIKKLNDKFTICNGKKVILFAPTYRGINRKDAHYPYDLIDFEKLYEICEERYVVLFKMHPWVSEPIPIDEKYKDRFCDISWYENINDLFYITDLLITDYSSNIFEFSLMRKPMLFFAFDKVQYAFSRGFHREYEEYAPGKVCYRFDEVIQAIIDKDFESDKIDKYVKSNFDFMDNNASDRVIDWIILDKMPEEIKDEIELRKKENERIKSINFSFMNT